jgi:hypothetical protein
MADLDTKVSKPIIYVGIEPLRRVFMPAMLENQTLVDCSQEDWIDAASNLGLFQTTLHLINMEHLDEAQIRTASKLLATSPLNTGQAEKLLAKPEKILSACTTIKSITLKRNDLNIKLWQQVGSALGINLNVTAATELSNKLNSDPARAVGVLSALAAGKYLQPTVGQVKMLSGSTSDIGLPWTLLAHLENHRFQDAKDLITQVEAIPTIAFIAKRLYTAMLLSEKTNITQLELTALLGDVSPYVQKQANTLAKRMGHAPLCEILNVAATADKLAKRSQPAAGLALLVGRLTLALS